MFEDLISSLITKKAFDKLVEIVRQSDEITRELWPADIAIINTNETEHIVISHIIHYKQLENPSKFATRRLVRKIGDWISSSFKYTDVKIQKVQQLFQNTEMELKNGQ